MRNQVGQAVIFAKKQTPRLWDVHPSFKVRRKMLHKGQTQRETHLKGRPKGKKNQKEAEGPDIEYSTI